MKQLYSGMTDAMRNAAIARDPALGQQFDIANDVYKNLVGSNGQRKLLEAVGGKPEGGYPQFFDPGGTLPTDGTQFSGGRDSNSAATWLDSKMRSPEAIAPFANPSVVPNDMWRQVVGQWLATRGQTTEGTYRPDLMAKQWGGDNAAPKTGVGDEVKTQLFTGPNGGTTANAADMDDLATLGRNAVVATSREGLTNTAGSVIALKQIFDWMKNYGGPVGMVLGGRALSSAIESPNFTNAIRGQGVTPLVDSLYAGTPGATQNIMQFQTNPPINEQ